MIGRISPNPLQLHIASFTSSSVISITSCPGREFTYKRDIRCDLTAPIREFKAHCKRGHLQSAIRILLQLQAQGYQRSSYTYVCLLQGCIQSNSLDEGRLIHDHILKHEAEYENVFVSTTMVHMYARCGNIEDARVVFDGLSERNLVTWSMMIEAYCKHEKYQEAIDTFWRMTKQQLKPDLVTFGSVFKACAGMGNLDQAKKFHDLMNEIGVKLNATLGNSLLNMYIKCGSIQGAQQVFDNMDEKDAGTWSVMISGYTKNSDYTKAIILFQEMQSTDVEPDEVTFLSILNAYAGLGDLELAKNVHKQIKKSGIKLTNYTWNALIDMYMKCGSLTDACKLFGEMLEKDVVTWNAMIAGVTKHGNHIDALRLHGQMLTEGVTPDQVSFVSVLNACTASDDLERGRWIHSQIVKHRGFLNTFVENALIDLYAKCGNLITAQQVFDEMCKRSVVSWNTIIAGYGKHGHNHEVLQLFERMVHENVKPDEFTFVSLLNACATLTALEQGLQIHHDVLVRNHELDVFVGNALIDMYAKCGRITDARKVLNRMPEKSVVSWNAMLTGYAQHGHGQEALRLGNCMLHKGVELNHVSIVGLLSACSHAGLVEEGRYCFLCMSQDYNIPLAVEHYGCMIDLLGRSGHLHEAEALLRGMPQYVGSHDANIVLWRALLGACRIHGNLELAMQVANHVLDMEPENGGILLLLSNIHGSTLGLDDEDTMVNEVDLAEDSYCGCIVNA